MGRSPMKVLFANKLVCFQLPRVLGALVCLLGAWTSGAQSSGIQTSLHGVKGGSILFYLNISSGEKIKMITWSFESNESHQILFHFKPEDESLAWENPKNRYEQRVRVTSDMTSLSIGNLTFEDHGCYRARVQYSTAKLYDQSFFLSVNEPIFPEIKVLSNFLTSDWCNLTLACPVLGATKEVTVTWESGDIPNILSQERLGLLSNSGILNLSLPRGVQDSSLTCIAKNLAEQKNSTLYLRDACKNSNLSKQHWQIGIFLLLILLGILGIGLWICRRKEKKNEVMDSSKNQRNSDNSIYYAVLSPDRPPEVQNQCEEACEQQPPERELPSTVYSEIQKTS
ncbi:SLAM family member 9-like isoform X1 [Phascolarctos cinereus]|uniref:SLAM family member 5-like isoform X1 n=2 Tax=Phascolarctos cinereus TaxID=38626 RepID=A0A6P5KT00_PHACI|nr:SLAM family member 5-like isoform X1 [Phascolarctos cinereus]XP_020847136.1 SLAM family member 5-like isoform X1 [Phascolarctos cinereus]